VLKNPAALLRSHVRSHNVSVIAASGVALLVSGVGWLLLYGAASWFTIIGNTIRMLGDAGLPASFHTVCFTVFAIIMGFTALDAWLFPHEEAIDRRTIFGHACDLVLFLPRITLASIYNFSAWARLPFGAMPYAARLLTRLRAEHRVPMYELPLEVPDDAMRERILAVFELTQLTEIRQERGQLYLRWSALAPDSFRASLPHHAHDDAPRMRSVTVLEKKDPLPGPERHPALRDRYDL
jgi:hypothetical protein